jgi:hypothetical protein
MNEYDVLSDADKALVDQAVHASVVRQETRGFGPTPQQAKDNRQSFANNLQHHFSKPENTQKLRDAAQKLDIPAPMRAALEAYEQQKHTPSTGAGAAACIPNARTDRNTPKSL